MSKPRLLMLSLCAALLVMAGCSSEKKETSQQPAAAVQRGTTPVDPATVGEITGQTNFEGTRPKQARILMDFDPVCVKEHPAPAYAEDNAVNDNGTLPNVFVYVKSGAEKYAFATPTEPVTLDQAGCLYKPHVLGVMVGQTLRIISSDQTTHNVHAIPRDNTEWNLSQPPGAPPIEKTFSNPEIMIPVKCNQHPWMKAYVGVVSNPLYAVTGSDGTFTIKGLPPGDYTIEAWSAIGGQGQTQDQKVTIGPKESKKVDFTFKIS
jgi:plastocyanin